jgi:Phosphoenolpyruvate hydrolase-like/Uncharacterised protein family (UPF0261)
VIERHPEASVRRALLHITDRGQAITAMSQALENFLLEEYQSGRVAGVIGIGGSGGTALVTPAMRALLDECVAEVTVIVAASKSIRSDVLVLCHGGPIANPPDAQHLLDRVEGLDGFYGASSMERLPTELAITRQTRDFADLRMRRWAGENRRPSQRLRPVIMRETLPRRLMSVTIDRLFRDLSSARQPKC